MPTLPCADNNCLLRKLRDGFWMCYYRMVQLFFEGTWLLFNKWLLINFKLVTLITQQRYVSADISSSPLEPYR